ncbi:MAG: 50S ribosomal protein L13 [Candidatus Aenigmarchaeota archaeon]|nr:50S ribosomal protein L13 [Candidatus Aenigmarchaeota archaeon]
MKYINAENQVLGRLSSIVAKMIIEGEQVYVVNAEKAVIIGNPTSILNGYRTKRARGDPYHGPFFPRESEKILKRTVRGMISYKTSRGREAFKRLKVFNSIPTDLVGKEFDKIKGAENKGEAKSITLGRISELI